jgi:hypothetical protein
MSGHDLPATDAPPTSMLIVTADLEKRGSLQTVCGSGRQHARREKRDERAAQKEPIDDKRQKAAFRDIAHEARDDEQPDNERYERCNCRLCAGKDLGGARRGALPARVTHRFIQFEESAAEHGGYRQEKRIACGSSALIAHKQPGGYRSTRAGYAGNQGECLSESEDCGVRDGQIIEASAFLSDRVGDAQKNAKNDERNGHDPEVAQGGLNGMLKEETEHDDRETAENDEPAHSGIGVGACTRPKRDRNHWLMMRVMSRQK